MPSSVALTQLPSPSPTWFIIWPSWQPTLSLYQRYQQQIPSSSSHLIQHLMPVYTSCIKFLPKSHILKLIAFYINIRKTVKHTHTHTYMDTHKHLNIYIYIYIYIYLCVCVCVCVCTIQEEVNIYVSLNSTSSITS